MAGKMVFERGWDFDPSNKPVTLNDLRFDEDTRAIILDMVPSGGGGGAVDSVNGFTGDVVLTQADVADTAGFVRMLPSERSKLAAIAAGATANSPDATLLARANHTGTQSADTLTDGTTNKAFLATERTKLAGIATDATANSSDATLLARANHTGTQLAATISDFAAAADARITAASLQPLDSDLTAIAALATTAYGRGFLTLANQAALVALLPSYQPLDSDLTSIAALTTTTFGRSLLTQADAATTLTTIGAQPADSDLTSIAALTTTAYGRAFLALADQAALMGLLPAASTTVVGVSRLATNAETTTGTATNIATTPAGVAAAVAAAGGAVAASETAAGVAELATQTETNTGTDDLRIVTPLKLQTRMAAYAQPLDSDLTSIAALTTTSYGRNLLTLAAQANLMALLSGATETAQGIIEIATQAEVDGGVDDVRAVTSAKLSTRLAGYQPADSDLTAIAALTTTSYGRALLALADGTALTALITAASTSVSGRVQLSDNVTARTGTSATQALTPANGAYLFAKAEQGGLEKVNTASATTGAITLDCTNASIFTVVPTGNITGITISNMTAVSGATATTITLIVKQGATPRTVALPTGGVWLGAAPTQVANKTCIITMMTDDAGTTWYCSGVVQA